MIDRLLTNFTRKITRSVRFQWPQHETTNSGSSVCLSKIRKNKHKPKAFEMSQVFRILQQLKLPKKNRSKSKCGVFRKIMKQPRCIFTKIGTGNWRIERNISNVFILRMGKTLSLHSFPFEFADRFFLLYWEIFWRGFSDNVFFNIFYDGIVRRMTGWIVIDFFVGTVIDCW